MEKKKGKEFREQIFDMICSNWPTHVTEVAKKLDLFPEDEKKQKVVIARIKYHFDQLARDGRVRVKRIDRALIAWPSEVEKYRMIHEMLGNF